MVASVREGKGAMGLGERIVFASRAMQGMKKMRGAMGLSLERAVWAMHDVLWPLYFEPTRRSSNIESDFYCLSGYRVALRECRSTNRSSRMRKLRFVEYEGVVLEAVPHVKVCFQGERLRIYYAVYRAANRLVIGSCGAHLETAGTRRCR